MFSQEATGASAATCGVRSRARPSRNPTQVGDTTIGRPIAALRFPSRRQPGSTLEHPFFRLPQKAIDTQRIYSATALPQGPYLSQTRAETTPRNSLRPFASLARLLLCRWDRFVAPRFAGIRAEFEVPPTIP